MRRYTNAVLTVIAVCLVWICVRDLRLWPRDAQAAEAIKDLLPPAPADPPKEAAPPKAYEPEKGDEPAEAKTLRADIVVARKYVLVDKDEKRVAEWQCVKGEPMLVFYAPGGNAMARMGILGNRPMVSLVNGRSQVDIGWHRGAVDLPEIVMRDMTGREFWGVPYRRR